MRIYSEITMNDAKQTLRCVRCEGELVAGSVTSSSAPELFTRGRIERWVEGDVQHTSLGNRSSENVMYSVKTWRCAACGNLEAFAHERVY